MAGPYNIPDLPGVPALNFVPGAEEGVELLAADGPIPFVSGASQWGIFLNGAPVVQADTVADFTIKKEWALSDAPQEDGTFQTYDKVVLPYDVRVRFVAGGSASNRQALLDSVDAIAGDLNLYDAVTPEAVYTSCNVVHYDYKRSARNGLGLVVVDVWLFQVRVVGATGALTTQSPNAAPAVNGGTVQTTPPSAAQQSVVTSGSVSFDYGN